MHTQRRRVIYMTDEEWALLTAHAKEHQRSISQVIRDMWTLAAQKDPAGPAETKRIETTAEEEIKQLKRQLADRKAEAPQALAGELPPGMWRPGPSFGRSYAAPKPGSKKK